MRLKSNRVGCALIYSFLLSMQNSPCQRLSASYILLNIYETELVFQHMPTSQSMIDPKKKTLKAWLVHIHNKQGWYGYPLNLLHDSISPVTTVVSHVFSMFFRSFLDSICPVLLSFRALNFTLNAECTWLKQTYRHMRPIKWSTELWQEQVQHRILRQSRDCTVQRAQLIGMKEQIKQKEKNYWQPSAQIFSQISQDPGQPWSDINIKVNESSA